MIIAKLLEAILENDKQEPIYPHLINTDSRTLRPGEIFFPLEGPNFDGQDYIPDAILKGASSFFCTPDYFETLNQQEKKLAYVVCDRLKAYYFIARIWTELCQNRHLKIIALTGSQGKSTCKELLFYALQTKGTVVATKDNENNEIGVPKTLLQIKENTQFAVIEIGARAPNDIRDLITIVQPEIAILLNARESHLAVFKSYENLKQTKLQIFDPTDRLKCGITLSEQKDISEYLYQQKSLKGLYFGHKESMIDKQGVSIVACHPHDSKSQVTLQFKKDDRDIIETIDFPSDHYAMPFNLAACYTALMYLNLEKKIDWTGFKPLKGRFLEHHLSIQNKKVSLIDDTYNASPSSMLAGLETIKSRQLNSNQNIALILGDMLELGDDSQRAHEHLGQEIQKMSGPHLILMTVGSQALHMSSGLKDLMTCQHYDTVADLLKDRKRLEKADLIYVKGSRGVRLDLVIDEMVGEYPAYVM